jgi:arylsulfatase
MEEVLHLGRSPAQGTQKGVLTMGITRREFLKSAAVAGAGVLAPGLLRYGQGNPSGNPKPNIILIFPDEWRWDSIGTLGLNPVQTPNLDLIAEKGVIFSNCFTCGPLCMPARASLMTGQYVHEHGQWNNKPPARNPKSPSHVRRMRDEAGYHTAFIGKSHLVLGSVTSDKPNLKKWGFDYSDEVQDAFGLARDATSSWSKWMKQLGKYTQYKKYMTYFEKNYENKNPWGTQPLDITPWNLTSEEHYDIYVGGRADQWIRNYSGSQPFYLQVNFPGPHYPEDSTTDFRDQFKIPDIDLGIYEQPGDPVAPLVEWSRTTLCNIQKMTSDQMRMMRLIYFANQLMVDVGIGKILQALIDRRMDENTWIFFSSDHGEMLGDHFLMYKLVFYESSTKVPLIIRPPSYIAGWVSTGLTDHLDLTTSLLDLAGLSPMFANHGTSLLDKVAAGPHGAHAQQGKEQVVSELNVPDVNANQLMLRTRTHKMNVQLSSPVEPVELYDLVDDPTESHNLIQNSLYQDVRTSMLDRVNTFWSGSKESIVELDEE